MRSAVRLRFVLRAGASTATTRSIILHVPDGSTIVDIDIVCIHTIRILWEFYNSKKQYQKTDFVIHAPPRTKCVSEFWLSFNCVYTHNYVCIHTIMGLQE